MLVNTIHFKSPWEIPFDPDETQRGVFYLNSTAQTQVDMMTSTDSYSSGDLGELNATAVVIPYKASQPAYAKYLK